MLFCFYIQMRQILTENHSESYLTNPANDEFTSEVIWFGQSVNWIPHEGVDSKTAWRHINLILILFHNSMEFHGKNMYLCKLDSIEPDVKYCLQKVCDILWCSRIYMYIMIKHNLQMAPLLHLLHLSNVDLSRFKWDDMLKSANTKQYCIYHLSTSNRQSLHSFCNTLSHQAY